MQVVEDVGNPPATQAAPGIGVSTLAASTQSRRG
jgi:hypothetical protein